MAIESRAIRRTSDRAMRPLLLRIMMRLLQGAAELAHFSRRDREVARRDPSLLGGRAEQVLSDHHRPIELLVFKEHVLSDRVSDALLLGDRVEVEAMACGLEGLWGPELERFSRAHDHPVGEQSARICLRCLQALLGRLVLRPDCKLLRRYMLRFLLFAEDVRLDFEVQGLLDVSNAYNKSKILSNSERLLLEIFLAWGLSRLLAKCSVSTYN